jgi:chromosome segregation ATPase
MRNIKPILLLVLSVLLLAFVSPSCQAEGSYRLYESELTRLQQICEKLDKLNNQLSNKLTISEVSLTQLQNELESCKAELTQLQNQLQASQAELTQLQNQLQASQAELTQVKNYLTTAENLLRKAEESFEQYKKEVKSKIRKLVIQRNVLTVIAIIAACFAL